MEWISVKEKLPQREPRSEWSMPLLFFDGSVHYGQVMFDNKNPPNYWWYCNDEYCASLKEVTHWMPLPEKPKDNHD